MESGVAFEPALYGGMFMRGVVVDHQVQRTIRRRLPINLAQEFQELLMPMPIKATADHRALQHIQRGKQGGGPMTDLVVGPGGALAGPERQPQLRSLQRLNLRLLIHA